MKAAGVEVMLRELRPSDRGFIATTWGRSYRDRAECSERVFREWHPRVIDRCLDTAETLVLASAAVPETVFAYAVGGPHLLHYAYSIPELRDRGLATTLLRKLMGDGPYETTHRLPRPREGATFNPFRIGVMP